MDLFSKSKYSQADINNLVASSVEESLYLEFKRSQSLSDKENVKVEIAKDVSAFANSDGGIIIYGIEESNHKASSISPIDGNIYTKEWIEQVINSRIQRRLPNYQIFPIRMNQNISESVYLIKINRTTTGPHMTSDGKYYKRSNFQVLHMEEYEVRDHYFRINATDLEIVDYLARPNSVNETGGKFRNIAFKIDFQVKNIGNTVEKDYKFELLIPEMLYLHGQRLPERKYLIRNEGLFMTFALPNQSPIFQNEITTVCTAILGINKEDFGTLQYYGIRTKLYYTSGIKERTFYPLEDFSHNGTLITKLQWMNR